MERMSEADKCPICGGLGWKTVERDGITAAERCECSLLERTRVHAERAGIPPLYEEASFENFSLQRNNPPVHKILFKAFNDANSFADQFPFQTKKGGLLFIGGNGSGKTHLATAVLRELIRKGFQGVFFSYQHLLEKIRSGYDPTSGASAREAYQAALDCEVLLLDDLGAHRVTDWVEDTINSIVTHRANHRLPVIATTNCRDESVDGTMPSATAAQITRGPYLSERIGMRARSRLSEMCQVISTRGVPDYRDRGL